MTAGRVLWLAAGSPFAVLSAWPAHAAAQAHPAWHALGPGPYAVGFRAVYVMDYSRVWRVRPDTAQPSTSGRPIRVSLWYPALPTDGAAQLTHRDYIHHRGAPSDAFRRLNAVVEAGRDSPDLYQVGAVVYDSVLSEPVGANWQAQIAEGTFPLVLYSAGWGSTSYDNSVLAEYLASHGYVVAAVPQLAPFEGASLPTQPFEVEMQARDVEFAYGVVRQLDGVSPDKLAVMGYSMGGGVALKVASRNPEVDAIVGLDPVYGHPDWLDMIRRFASFDIRRLQAASLTLLAGEPDARLDETLIASMHLSDRYVARVGRTIHGDFNDFWMTMTRFHPLYQAAVAIEGRKAYSAMCRYILNFLNGTLRGDTAGLAYVGRPSEANGMDSGLVRIRRIPKATIPTPEDIVLQLHRAGIEPTAAGLRTLQERYPDLPMTDESATNGQGYSLLRSGRARDAVLVFRLNVALHPTSANAYDSLADGLLAAGDSVQAAVAYQGLLRVLPDDHQASTALKERLGENARAFLDRIRP